MYYCDQPEATCKAPSEAVAKALQMGVKCPLALKQLQALHVQLHPGPPRVVWHATSWSGSAPATTRRNEQHRLQMPGTAGGPGPGWLGGFHGTQEICFGIGKASNQVIWSTLDVKIETEAQDGSGKYTNTI